MNLRLERRGNLISLLPALARGGEGSIHPVLGEPGIVAKVFASPSPKTIKKLGVMIDNPPVVSASASIVLAWPSDRLLNSSGECVGYVMPYVKDKEPLFELSHPSSRPSWADFAFRLLVAKNITLAVSALHRHGYVIGDINEFNILVGADASVAVVDMDSIQVRTINETFRCNVGKPEFTPAELIRANTTFDCFDRYPHHDAFGLGVVIFLLLMEGNHPFSARYVGTGTRHPLTQRIAHGFWPYSTQPGSNYQPRRQAPPFESLPKDIQRLMHLCFEAGHQNPTCRPSSDEWHQAIEMAEQEWRTVRARLRYCFHRKVRPKAWVQNVLVAPNLVRNKVAWVPRKVWIAISFTVVITLLVLAMVSQAGRSEPSRPARNTEQSPQMRGAGGELMGEETPWLWQEAQRQNRMKK